MKRKIILYIFLLGLIGIMPSCKKDGTNVEMLSNPVAPTLKTLPDLTLQRSNGASILTFIGTSVNPGFQASASYVLEAAAMGTDFADPVSIITDVQCDSLNIAVSVLNGILLKKFPADQVSSIDFRIRALLVVDAGTGALGTSSNPLEYISAVKTAEVTLYGFPRLDLLNSGMAQKIESPLGNGIYEGFVKLNVLNPFTLVNPDDNTTYGGSGGTLAITGPAIIPSADGWHILTVNTTALTYATNPYMIGLIGSATPNGWNTPDQKMDYDPITGTWHITIDLIDGEIKFRKNDGWAWNLGGTPDNLTQGGANLAVTAGNYTVTLTIINDATGTCTLVKN
jgi:starch-binding outer membrane protein SusE/F